MSYRIASFNLHNMGESSLSTNNPRDIKTIARIIKEEKFDVVALQEVLSEGKALESPGYTKKTLLMELGSDWDFSWAQTEREGSKDTRNEGYAFVWNKRRIRLCSSKVSGFHGEYERVFYPRIYKSNTKDLKRFPFYGRFTPSGMIGGTNVEFRLICVHTQFGDDTCRESRLNRTKEIETIIKEIYPQINDKRYGNPLVSYTVILGDYNAELWTAESSVWQRQLKKSRGESLPAILNADPEGNMVSERYDGRRIKTVQDQLTTLKTKISETSVESFNTAGYSHNYDHFSYEEEQFHGVHPRVKRVTDAVNKYCRESDGGDYDSDFEKYYKTISDHIPIVMEIDLRQM